MPNKRIDLVSLPRDTLLHNDYRNNKLNFAYAKGGTELLMSQIENLLGIPVDFYVTVNLKGFIALVDQIDGVDFDIDRKSTRLNSSHSDRSRMPSSA